MFQGTAAAALSGTPALQQMHVHSGTATLRVHFVRRHPAIHSGCVWSTVPELTAGVARPVRSRHN